MDASTLFGIGVCSVILLVWSSGDHVRQKLGLLLLIAWAGSNVAVNCMGFSRAPLIVPSMDAVIAILVAMIGYANRSRVAAAIFAIYAFVGAIHIAAFVMRAEMTYNYYATLNAAFALQLIILGASSAWVAFYRWVPRVGECLRPYPARW